MGIFFMDGFDYNTNNGLKGWFNFNSGFAAGGPAGTRFNYGGYWGIGGGGSSLQFILPTSMSRVYAGFAFRSPDQINERFIFILSESASGSIPNANSQVSVMLDMSVNRLMIRRGGGPGGTFLAIGTTPIIQNVWYYIEIKATISNSIAANDFIVYVNGVPDINLPAGTDTQAQTTSFVDRLDISNGHFDDFYLSDSSVLLTNPRIYTTLPNGDGSSSQFTGSDGNSVNNYLLVSGTNTQTATYARDSVVGDKDLYAMGDIPFAAAAIYATQQNNYMVRDNAGFRTARMVLRSGGTNYEGSDLVLTDTPTIYKQVRETDPATSAAWTVSGVNAIECGAKVQA